MAIRRALLGFLIISSSLCLALAQTPPSDVPSAYELLEMFNFPKGILPKGVVSYKLNSDGSFEVEFESECEFKVAAGYLLHYEKKISGKIESGSLKQLDGVSVKVLFVWLGIDELDRSGAKLDFYIGPFSASFPLTDFEESPQCGCGFDCGDALVADA